MRAYLEPYSGFTPELCQRLVSVYRAARQKAHTDLRDGSNMRPHFSLRTLCRALIHAQVLAPVYSLPRALYEGVCMSFLTQLNLASYSEMRALIDKALIRAPLTKAKLDHRPHQPDKGFVAYESYWLRRGNQEPEQPKDYIITPTIKRQLRDVARVLASGKFPILLQGPTSSGKTSMVGYLAKLTGHKLVRINNHEHTDIQEYLGSYVADENGRLSFQPGVLVQAVRNGHWIVLDELNLAPTDVLEALNRLLDDNRELYIPETQETVRAHPNFMLFATQNPPGMYGGRKALSRAFRNRFIEIHFSEIPHAELQVILHKRSQIPESRAKLLVQVMRQLQERRQDANVFAGKDGFITLRDLFRWAERYHRTSAQRNSSSPASPAAASTGPSSKRAKLTSTSSTSSSEDRAGVPAVHDDWQALANDGYMLLAERIRHEDEKAVVLECIEKVLKKKVDTAALYECEHSTLFAEAQRQLELARSDPTHPLRPFTNVVWTRSMKRLFYLVERCMDMKEPVLLVGDTGCGKTTVCQILTTLLDQDLHIINCHQNTETSDFLGGLRPARKGTSSEGDTGADCGNSNELKPEVSPATPGDAATPTSGAADATTISAHEVNEEKAGASKTLAQAEGESTPAKLSKKQRKKLRRKERQQQQQQQQGQAEGGPTTAETKTAAAADQVKAEKHGPQAQDEASPSKQEQQQQQQKSKNKKTKKKKTKQQQEKGDQNVKLFEWCDGPLVIAMKKGDGLLIDEISLADDSVLERLNSVLEPTRGLLLAEKGGVRPEQIVADPKFHILATMNPGGDFGKKELSPALRNRFTEIWVPAVTDHDDLKAIVSHSLQDADLQRFTEPIIGFPSWLKTHEHFAAAVSLRDHLAWARFIRNCRGSVAPAAAFVHGGCLVYVDGLGITGSGASGPVEVRQRCVQKLLSYLPADEQAAVRAQGVDDGTFIPTLSKQPTEPHETDEPPPVSSSSTSTSATTDPDAGAADANGYGMEPFFVSCGRHAIVETSFTLNAPTTAQNMFRVLRAMHAGKAILLEGSPGVGKTSLVMALARATGHHVERINLSEQTDVSDLFGADLPVEGKAGVFAWRDGPLLRALRQGDWVVLDELNLASQSVLEGLNACLDHRGEVYIPELNRTFKCDPNNFKLFACQNPVRQGGGRKGLPLSFLNRFTQVHVDVLSPQDMLSIVSARFGAIPEPILEAMIAFNSRVRGRQQRAAAKSQGTDMNLRDVFRWCEAMTELQHPLSFDPRHFVPVIYGGQLPETLSIGRSHRAAQEQWTHHLARLSAQLLDPAVQRSLAPGSEAEAVGQEATTDGQREPSAAWLTSSQLFNYPRTFAIDERVVTVGRASLPRHRGALLLPPGAGAADELLGTFDVLPQQLGSMEALALGLRMGWMVNLSGPPASGKTQMVRMLASLTGNTLCEFAMNSSIDTLELLGGFEQLDLQQHKNEVMVAARNLFHTACDAVLRTTVAAHPAQGSGALARDDDGAGARAKKPSKQQKRTKGNKSKNKKEKSEDNNAQAQTECKPLVELLRELHSGWHCVRTRNGFKGSDVDVGQLKAFMASVQRIRERLAAESRERDGAVQAEVLQQVDDAAQELSSTLNKLQNIVSQRTEGQLLMMSGQVEEFVICVGWWSECVCVRVCACACISPSPCCVQTGTATFALSIPLVDCRCSYTGMFTWRNGLLVDALTKGYWLLIDNVNFCSPSVLDRLNGLLEPKGVLIVNERGVIDGQVCHLNKARPGA